MEWDDLSPEQQRQLDEAAAEFERQLARVGVDLQAASPRMRELEPPKRRKIAGDENEESYIVEVTVDVSGILRTLRQLPDGAGTAAFVATYNADHPDWRERL